MPDRHENSTDEAFEHHYCQASAALTMMLEDYLLPPWVTREAQNQLDELDRKRRQRAQSNLAQRTSDFHAFVNDMSGFVTALRTRAEGVGGLDSLQQLVDAAAAVLRGPEPDRPTAP